MFLNYWFKINSSSRHINTLITNDIIDFYFFLSLVVIMLVVFEFNPSFKRHCLILFIGDAYPCIDFSNASNNLHLLEICCIKNNFVVFFFVIIICISATFVLMMLFIYFLYDMRNSLNNMMHVEDIIFFLLKYLPWTLCNQVGIRNFSEKVCV